MAQHPEAGGLATVETISTEDVDKAKGYAYAAMVEWTGTNYAGHVPDLPGYFATADTVAEVLDLMREGVPFHIEGLLRDNEPVPEPRAQVAVIVVRDVG